ncbi:MAG: sulfate adenylyltransferase [Methanomassiliicoccales archaeon]
MEHMIEPYGGKLIQRLATPSETEKILSQSDEMPHLRPFADHIYDAEKICTGAYSPLDGFMCRNDFEAVLSTGTLSSGLSWTMPIFLSPEKGNSGVLQELNASDELLLDDSRGKPFALLKIEEVFHYSREAVARAVYGTTDQAHPNVADLGAFEETAIGGRLLLLNRLEHGRHELLPNETRALFEKLGWKHVAAYQARNPPHTAHEYIQRLTLEREDIDGLFVQPIVGRLKKGDYKTDVIMRAYEAFVSAYYRSNRVMLGSLSISMRYAGPKAVLFYAIVRRNYGCSHYIVGRDQAGVGNYYDPYACHRIFDQYDVGVIPLRYEETFYCKICGVMVSRKVCPHADEFHESTSQTRIRKLLAEGKAIPPDILRPEVAEILRSGDVINE